MRRPSCWFRIRPSGVESYWVLWAIVAVAGLVSLPALAQDTPESTDEALQHCLAAADPAVVLIASCSSAINSHRLKPEGLAVALTVRGSAYGSVDRPDLGLEDVERALSITPDQLGPRAIRADLRGKLRDYRAAIADLDPVVAGRPDDTLSRRKRGQYHAWLGEREAAIADFQAALAIKPEAATYVDLSIAYGDADDPTHQLENLEAALRLVPDDPSALYSRGLFHFDRAEYADAASDLAKAADAEKEDAYPVIWAYLGAKRAGAADAEEALARRAAPLNLEQWPGQVIELYLGRRTAESVSPPDGGHVPWMRDGYRCESLFYVAEWRLIQGDKAAAIDGFKATVATGITEFVEHRAARMELGRLAPG